MKVISCLAGIDKGAVATLSSALRKAGAPPLGNADARLNVTDLGQLGPTFIVCDIDGLAVDALEVLRQLRFVLPGCIIAIYTGVSTAAWALACHLAGANCLLSKLATKAELTEGIGEALKTGCFTDPRFAAA
jgi:DNA-binding NarL/FixJ family response regulator